MSPQIHEPPEEIREIPRVGRPAGPSSPLEARPGIAVKRRRPQPSPTGVFCPGLMQHRGKQALSVLVSDKTETKKCCPSWFRTKPRQKSVVRRGLGQNRGKKELRGPIWDETEAYKRCAARFGTKPKQKRVFRPDFGQNRGTQALRGLVLRKIATDKTLPLRVTAFHAI